MSMPNSRLLVATMARSCPRLSWSSITIRCSRASEPWCALTKSASPKPRSTANSLSCAASRSAPRRALQKIMVLRCCCTSSRIFGVMLGQMLVRRSTPAAVAGPLRSSVVTLPIEPMSSMGTTTSICIGLRAPASTMETVRGAPSRYPPRKRATSSSGRCVADSPMRWGATAVSSSRRSSDNAKCAPRLVAAIAWISSMMTVSMLASVERADEVSMRYKLSGVVINTSGGWRNMR